LTRKGEVETMLEFVVLYALFGGCMATLSIRNGRRNKHNPTDMEVTAEGLWWWAITLGWPLFILAACVMFVLFLTGKAVRWRMP
jgi:hypothetical protein